MLCRASYIQLVREDNLSQDSSQPESGNNHPISKKDAEIIKATFLREIINTRRSKGLSQKKLQAASGVQQAVIARLELGESDPKLSTLIKVLHPLGMNLTVSPLDGSSNDSHSNVT